MLTINHSIHVYQRPKQGTAFLKRYPIYNYQHSIVNQGWFDTASGDIAVQSDSDGQQILEQYLGCYVAIYVDNPVLPVWEGIINRITFNSGGASYTISLDELVNRASVVYTGAANAAAETAVVNNTASQAIYGIKQKQIEFGVDTSAATQKTVLRDTILAQRAFPQTSVSQAQGTTNIVHLECIGMFHTMEWGIQFTAPSAGTFPADSFVTSYFAANVNGGTFFASSDASKITANAMTVPLQQRAISYWEIILKVAETGDSSNYWVAGIMPNDPNVNLRRPYYKLANYAVEYTALKSDGLKPRNLYGKPIKPWLVVPDRAIRVEDALVGYGGSLLTDPTATYIQSVQYDASSQSVQWFGSDNTTARAAFLLGRGFLPTGSDFGAPLRTLAT